MKLLFLAIQLSSFNHQLGLETCKSAVWGFYAHKQINRLAVFTVPDALFSFAKENIEFLTEHAVDPDKRRYAVEDEAPRHYIDIDHYRHNGGNPFDEVPRKWKDAVKKYSEDTLKAYGIVPWHIETMCYRLTKAFNEENFDKILRTASDLGHYIGDAHVPLHTTENYNGQMTNQKGIHGFWESRVPELLSSDFDFFVGKARYIQNTLDFAWEIVEQSHAAVDSVLKFEKELSEQFGEKKYSFETRGNTTVKVYSQEFTSAYDKMLNGMIERRMRQAIIAVGSLWFSCWVDAGKPDLVKFKGRKVSEESLKEMEEEDKHYQKGKHKGRVCD